MRQSIVGTTKAQTMQEFTNIPSANIGVTLYFMLYFYK